MAANIYTTQKITRKTHTALRAIAKITGGKMWRITEDAILAELARIKAQAQDRRS